MAAQDPIKTDHDTHPDDPTKLDSSEATTTNSNSVQAKESEQIPVADDEIDDGGWLCI